MKLWEVSGVADVNAGISDLRNWEQELQNATTFNVTKNNDKYIVSGTPRGGGERFIYKIYTEKNKKYRFKMTRDATYNVNSDNNPDLLFVSNVRLGRTPPSYLSMSESEKSSILNKIEMLTNGSNSYELEFNSGDNEELYIEFEFQNVKDYVPFSFIFSDISLKMVSEGPDYLIESAYKTAYYFKGGEKIDTFIYMVLIRDEDILEALPQEITPGSWAYTAAGKKVWQMDFDREWIPAFDEDE